MTKHEAITALQELKSALEKVESIGKSVICINYNCFSYTETSPTLTVFCDNMGAVKQLFEQESDIEPFDIDPYDRKETLTVEGVKFYNLLKREEASA